MQRLNYIWPAGEVVTTSVDSETPMYTSWLHSMVETNPEVIFFYTVDSTDIFEEDKPLRRIPYPQHVDEVVLSSKGDAQKVLDNLRKIVAGLGNARVSDLYILSGLQDQVTYADDQWGWKDLSAASIAATPISGEGVKYMLDLPRPELIR